MNIRNVALQAKVKSTRHNGAHAALKVVLLSDFHRGVSCSARRHGKRQSRDRHHFISQLLFLFFIYHLICYFSFMAGLQCHAIKNINRNHSIK